MATKFPARCSAAQQISAFESFQSLLLRKWGVTTETLISRYYVTREKLRTGLKRDFIFGLDTPPHHET